MRKGNWMRAITGLLRKVETVEQMRLIWRFVNGLVGEQTFKGVNDGNG